MEVGERNVSRREFLRGGRSRESCITYDSRLVEEAVFLELRRRERLLTEYHRQVEPLYRFFSAEEREAAFAKVHRHFFRRLGFAEAVTTSLREFPLILAKTKGACLAKAMSPGEEGATIAGAMIGMRLLPTRFLDLSALQKYLRHELMHVADMIDERFGYSFVDRLAGIPPAQENLVRERYRVLWDIYIDGRLARKGKETVADKQSRYQEFTRFYPAIPLSAQPEIFEELWRAEHISHREMLDMAKDVKRLFAKAGDGLGEVETLPGTPCSLCRFPTYQRQTVLKDEVIALIREDFPAWTPGEGACERCVEVYQMQAGCW